MSVTLKMSQPAIRYPFLVAEGSRQMALDEAMLQATIHDGRIRLRFYDWVVPTISLGRNQKRELPEGERWDTLPVIRRPTGGRAVLHQNDVTYAITLPITEKETLSALYTRIIEPIASAIERLVGICPDFVPYTRSRPLNQTSRIPCFQAPSHRELLLGGKKILGAAMLRKEGALLQHGTILFAPDSHLQQPFLGENPVGLSSFRPELTREEIVQGVQSAL